MDEEPRTSESRPVPFPADPRSSPSLGLGSVPYSGSMLCLGMLAVLVLELTAYAAALLLPEEGFRVLEPDLLRGVLCLLTNHPLACLILVFGTSLAWILFGVPLSRAAILRITRDRDITVRQALSFGLEVQSDTRSFPLIVVAVSLFLAATLGLLGLLGHVPWVGPILLGVLFPVALVTSLVLVVLALTAVLGLGLGSAILATESIPGLEALSRAIAYLFSRPLQFLFLHAVVIGFAWVLQALGALVIDISLEGLGLFLRGPALDTVLAIAREGRPGVETASFPLWTGGVLLYLYRMIGLWASAGAAVAFYLSGTAAAYVRLRSEIDGILETDLTDTRGLKE